MITGSGGLEPLSLPLSPEPAASDKKDTEKDGDSRDRVRIALPGLPPRTGADDLATLPVPLLEPDASPTDADGTPLPLPPSPASAAAEVWLEDAVTRPSMLSDIAGSPGSISSGLHPVVAAASAHPTGSVSAAADLRNARRLLILSSATCFVVGLILGALLFRGRSEPPPQSANGLCTPEVSEGR